VNDIVVIFSEAGGAKILHGEDGSKYKTATNALVNPEFPPGIPPHQWKLVDGKIGTTNSASAVIPQNVVIHRHSHLRLALSFLAGASVATIIQLVLRCFI
jgi:hypothetical protein